MTFPQAAKAKRDFAQKAALDDLLLCSQAQPQGRVLYTKNLGCGKILCESREQWKHLAVDPFDLLNSPKTALSSLVCWQRIPDFCTLRTSCSAEHSPECAVTSSLALLTFHLTTFSWLLSPQTAACVFPDED